MDTPDPLNPTSVASARSEFEAGAIVAALAAVGIEATLTGEFTAGFRAEAPGVVQVVVKQSDAEHALAAIEDWRRNPPGDFDWSNVDVGEPEDE